MRLVAKLSIKLTLGIVSNLLLPNFAMAEAPASPEIVAQRQCQRRLVETPTTWVDESLPLSTDLIAQGGVCSHPLRFDREVIRSSWNGKQATIRRGTCNGLPLLEINVPGEANNIYIVNTMLRLFSWNQAYTLGCHNFARDEADKRNWHLPRRNQRALFKFMMAVPGFLNAEASFPRDNGRVERVFTTFVEEENFNESVSCYANTFTAFAFSDSFFYNSVIGLTDRDFQARADQAANSGDLVSTAREQTIQVLIRYSLGGQVLADEATNRNLQEHLARVITREQKNEISRLYRSAGLERVDIGLARVRDYVTRNIDWTRVFSDGRFSGEMRNRQALLTSAGNLQALNRSRAEGGGVPVYCVTEMRKNGR